MYELLGPHVNQTWGGIPELVATWKPPVALIMDHADAWHWVKRETPNTIMVGRWFFGEPPDYERIDPIQHARNQTASILRAAANSPYDYIMGDNEPVVRSRKAMRNLALYDIERMKILKAVGKKAAIGGWASGNPPDMSILEEYLPAFKEAIKYGAVLHLHQYDWPEIGATGVWNPYRHELLYNGCPEHGWAGVPVELRIPIIITEFGLDMGVQFPGIRVGWRGAHITPAQYNEQLERANRRYMASPYILGACIFCVGNASQDWVMFDYWSDVWNVANVASPVYRKVKQPPKDNDILGIDVSDARGDFPWVAAEKEDGVDFAIMRSSVRTKLDGRFTSYWKNCSEKTSMRRGIYHYLYPENVKAQARLFARIAYEHPCQVVRYKDGRLGGYFLDVEQAGLNANHIREFLEEWRGRTSLPLDYYTSGYKWSRIVGKSSWKEFGPISWLADWRNVERFAVPGGFRRADVKIRQITSNNGHVMSYDKRLDINRWVGDPEEFWSLS